MKNIHLLERIDQRIENISSQIQSYLDANKRIFVSSSFQSHSIPLLHIISSIDNAIPVYFLNTGFHFPETLIFKEEIGSLLGLEVIDVVSPISKLHQRDQLGRFFFCSKSEYCCYINKTLPLDPILQTHDVWITGVRKDQNENRRKMSIEAKGPHNTMRYHPMIDWNSKMIWEYRVKNDLPSHPLEQEGYLSIGCKPCTQKYELDSREGRWTGQNKTECGLHIDLIKE